MNTATEQKEVATNTVETFTRMSEVALSGMERLAALNLSTARESLQQGLAASKSISRAKNGKDQDCENQEEGQNKVQNRLSGAGVERVTAYVRGVHEIVMESQVEFAELMGRHMSSFSKNGRMAFPGMQLLENFAQQTTEMTQANVRNVAEMTKAGVRKVTEAADEVADDVLEATDDVAEEADEVAEEAEKGAEKTSQGRRPQKVTKETEKGRE